MNRGNHGDQIAIARVNPKLWARENRLPEYRHVLLLEWLTGGHRDRQEENVVFEKFRKQYARTPSVKTSHLCDRKTVFIAAVCCVLLRT